MNTKSNIFGEIDLTLKKSNILYIINYSKNGLVWFYNAVLQPKNADKIANTADPDQTAPTEQSDLGLLCLFRPTVSVRVL